MFGWMASQPTPAQKQLGQLIFDESIHVISSFELNRIASLTYGELVCDEIFEMLEQVQASPMEHSILAVQKSLVVTKHILIYGSEKCVNSAIALQRPIETLLEFNTILWAQKMQGPSAFMYRLKGGGVDKGYPVREAAKEVHPLIFDLDKLRRVRNDKADPNSLVPVGNDNVAFASDDVRHYMLKKRIEEQYKIQTRSNLVKAEGGFGAGYSSRDGKSVVGAAHSLDEMVKRAEWEKQKFSDDGQNRKYENPNLAELSDVVQKESAYQSQSNTAEADLLWGGNEQQQSYTQPVVDLLDFSSEVTHTAASAPSSTTDIFGSNDLLGGGGGGGAPPAAGGSSSNIDIFLHPSQAPTTATQDHDLMGLSSMTNNNTHTATSTSATAMPSSNPSNVPPQAAAPPKKAIMQSNEDRFAALDALEVPAPKTTAMNSQSIFSSALDAKNRLMNLAAGSGNDYNPSSEPTISVSSAYGSTETYSSTAAVFGGINTNTNTNVNPSLSAPAPSTMGYNADNYGFGGGTSLSSSMQGLSLQPTSSLDKDASAYASSSGFTSSTKSSGLRVSQVVNTYGGEEDDGFVMGGTMGSGLEPTAPAPGAPPPPPPP